MKNNITLKKDIGIIKHFLKLAQKINKNYIPTVVIASIFKALTPFINIIMPKFIIDELLGSKRIEVIIMIVLFIIFVNFVLNIINKCLGKIVNIKNLEIVYGFDSIIGNKIMDLDFEKIEDPEILNLKEQAIFPVRDQGIILDMVDTIMNSFTQLVSVVTLGGVLFTLTPILVFFIVAMVLVNTFIFKKIQHIQYKMNQNMVRINREYMYFYNIGDDFTIGKDIRLYNMSPFIMQKINGFNSRLINIIKKDNISIGKYNGLSKVNVQIQMLGTYGYLVYKLLNGIGIGNFTMYANTTINFSTAISEFLNAYIKLTQMCRYLDLYLEFEGMENKKDLGTKKIGKPESINIEFRNVAFKYPRSKSYTLKNININIKPGEKLSVVGLNGAGKTTFIKLLCRLYEPTEGEILLNGVNILEYDYEEYMKLLSVVFQDFKLLAFSIKENIGLAQWEAAADKEIEEVIDKAGFGEDLKKLNKGIYTSIYKVFDKEGIEFSGGQSQKLAIARAIYKNAPIVILDEPTAALDPFAEFEIYSKFNELVGEKTAIYISHRLSSCKFCDNIAVFKDGEIVEYGNHEKLVKGNGLYEEMYTAQAQYYV